MTDTYQTGPTTATNRAFPQSSVLHYFYQVYITFIALRPFLTNFHTLLQDRRRDTDQK